MRRWPPPIERLFAKVEVTETCWLWTGLSIWNGYGTLRANGRNVLAHRLAYELMVGPIPDGLDLDHLCRVRNCVNPDHLEPVTRQENVNRGIAARGLTRKSHCVNGHELTGHNAMRIGPNGKWRQCRICRNASHRRYRLRLKETAT